MTEHMINAEGHLVPVEKVKMEDRLEDELVKGLYQSALDVSQQLAKFKASAFADVNAFVDLLAEKYGAVKGGKKGNMTLMSYDGLTKIQVSVGDFIQFGPQLQVAKQLIDECIKDWGDGANANIQALVNHAFRVDKANQVNTGAILGLRRLNIEDLKWKKAMDAITDSMKVVMSKMYIRFYARASTECAWRPVAMDLANVS